MPKRATLRASDADRDQVADRLRAAATEGRIVAHELEDRVATALRAQTYGELDAVVADLPGNRTGVGEPERRRLSRQPAAMVAYLVAATVLVGVLAMVVLAGLAALSGLWIFFAVFFFARHGSGGRHGRRPQYRRGIAGR